MNINQIEKILNQSFELSNQHIKHGISKQDAIASYLEQFMNNQYHTCMRFFSVFHPDMYNLLLKEI